MWVLFYRSHQRVPLHSSVCQLDRTNFLLAINHREVFDIIYCAFILLFDLSIDFLRVLALSMSTATTIVHTICFTMRLVARETTQICFDRYKSMIFQFSIFTIFSTEKSKLQYKYFH